MASSSDIFENALAALRERMANCELKLDPSTSGSNNEQKTFNTTASESPFAALENETEKRRALDEMLGCLSPIKPIRKVTTSDKMEQSSRTIFIENLPDATTSDDLSSFFDSCGPIERINLVTNSMTGKITGFAYIVFVDHQAYNEALKLDKSIFLGSIITVEPKENPSKTFGKSPRFITRYHNQLRQNRARAARPY